MRLFNFETDKPYLKLKNNMLQIIQDFISDYFDYTTKVSITESEWLSHFEWLENVITWRDTNREDYHKEALKDLVFDLLFNQNKIKEQIENDIEIFGNDSELIYIKDFYNKWKYLFNFRIDSLENE